jgi:hypothetical protein
MNQCTYRIKTFEATIKRNTDIGFVVKLGIELKHHVGNEVTLESDNPDIAFSISRQWFEAMHLARCDKTDERSINRFGAEVDKMFEPPVNTNQQFFIIVDMSFVGTA